MTLDVCNKASITFRAHKDKTSSVDWGMVIICVLFSGALAVWLLFDHSWPYWDAASHVKDSFRYAELYRHLRFWNPQWIHDFLTASFAYPLTIHAFSGLLKAIFGSDKWVDGLSLLCFSLILNVSVYQLAYTLFRDRLMALISVVIINCYPLTSSLSHFPMLDFPHLALYSLGMLTIGRWQQQSSWPRTLALGLGLGLAITSKQISVLYFVVPGLLLLIATMIKAKPGTALRLGIAGSIALSFFLLWVIPNAEKIRMHVPTIGADVERTSFFESFLANVFGYLGALPESMSPTLCIVFLTALCFLGRDQFINLRTPILSALSGMLLLSCIQFSNSEQRYIIPVLLSTTLITTTLLAKLLRNNRKILKVATLGILLVALGQFVLLNYTPYPVLVPQSIAQISQQLIGPESPSKEHLVLFSKPTPAGDVWGQEWIIDTIAELERRRPCWLMVMPSTPQLSVHTLDVISLYKNARVRPTTIRNWTLLGDKVSYSEKTLGYFQWFLLKTGNQGNKLKDKQSYEEYQKMVDYVQNSNKFALKARRVIADSSILSLYRLNN